MKSMDWLDLPAVAMQVLDEVERTGEPIVITKNGVSAVRIEPIDEATRSEYEAHRAAG